MKGGEGDAEWDFGVLYQTMGYARPRKSVETHGVINRHSTKGHAPLSTPDPRDISDNDRARLPYSRCTTMDKQLVAPMHIGHLR